VGGIIIINYTIITAITSFKIDTWACWG